MIGKSLLPLTFLCLCAQLAAASWPNSWVVRGVVVGKMFRPSTLPRSLGEDGIYKLELRDEHHRIQRQLVSREVYRAYEIGDSFDSSAPLPARKTRPDSKTAARPRPKVADTLSENPPPVSIVPVTQSRNQLASAYFTRDMLPEVEGF
jgi:hypothetical protein